MDGDRPENGPSKHTNGLVGEDVEGECIEARVVNEDKAAEPMAGMENAEGGDSGLVRAEDMDKLMDLPRSPHANGNSRKMCDGGGQRIEMLVGHSDGNHAHAACTSSMMATNAPMMGLHGREPSVTEGHPPGADSGMQIV